MLRFLVVHQLFYQNNPAMQDLVIIDVVWLGGYVLGTLLSPQKFQRTQIRPVDNGIVMKEAIYRVRDVHGLPLHQSVTNRVATLCEEHSTPQFLGTVFNIGKQEGMSMVKYGSGVIATSGEKFFSKIGLSSLASRFLALMLQKYIMKK